MKKLGEKSTELQWSAATISNCANWHHNGPLIMAITQRPLATASCRHCSLWTHTPCHPPLTPLPPHGAALFGCFLLCFAFYFSILNRRCLLILCANTLNGNFDEQDEHREGEGILPQPKPNPTHRETHAKCRHLHSQRIFHVTFAKAKQTFAGA